MRCTILSHVPISKTSKFMIEIKLTLTDEQAEELFARVERIEKDIDTILKAIYLLNENLKEEKNDGDP
mgnify:CR=1 FL=1